MDNWRKSMDKKFINLTIENIESEHLCCAISDKKHQMGVVAKKNWLKEYQKVKKCLLQKPCSHLFLKICQSGMWKLYMTIGM